MQTPTTPEECNSADGLHNFKPRYSEEYNPTAQIGERQLKKQTYHGDVCSHCGMTVNTQSQTSQQPDVQIIRQQIERFVELARYEVTLIPDPHAINPAFLPLCLQNRKELLNSALDNIVAYAQKLKE